MPEFNPGLEKNDAIYASVIGGGEVAWAQQPTGPNYIWTSDFTTESLYKMDAAGSFIYSFFLGYDYATGVAADGSDSIWAVKQEDAAYPSQLYKLTDTGSKIECLYFGVGANYGGMDLDAQGCIWTVDRGNGPIYKFDQTPSLIGTIETPSSKPYGVAIDGSGSLLNSDGSAESVFTMRSFFRVTDSFGIPGYGANIELDSNDSFWMLVEGPPNYIYHVDDTGSAITSFTPPSGNPNGIGIDSNDCIWLSDGVSGFDNYFYQLDRAGSEISSFSTPSDNPRANVVGPNDCIYHYDNGIASLYQYTQGGSLVQTTSIGPRPADMTFDNAGCLWMTQGQYTGNCVYKTDLGSAIYSWADELDNPQGLAADTATGCLYHTNGSTPSMYKVRSQYRYLSSFHTPSNSTRGLSVQDNGSIWNVDSGSIYRLDSAGSVLESFQAPSGSPEGIGVTRPAPNPP